MASSSVVNSPLLQLGSSSGDFEDEDELFEIDLDAFNSIPPPHYWDSYFTSTSSALLANCLLPIADVSSAVPTATTTAPKALSLGEQLLVLRFRPFQGVLGYAGQGNDNKQGKSSVTTTETVDLWFTTLQRN